MQSYFTSINDARLDRITPRAVPPHSNAWTASHNLYTLAVPHTNVHSSHNSASGAWHAQVSQPTGIIYTPCLHAYAQAETCDRFQPHIMLSLPRVHTASHGHFMRHFMRRVPVNTEAGLAKGTLTGHSTMPAAWAGCRAHESMHPRQGVTRACIGMARESCHMGGSH